jgi:predicted Zn finger-like uncharacterized protein
MRIVCPECAAAYDVPDDMLVSSRSVRCARCGCQWSAVPATQDEADRIEPTNAMPGQPTLIDAIRDTSEAPGPPPPAPVADPSDPPVPPRWMRWQRDPAFLARAGWAASLVLLLGLAWAAYAWRASIMHAWPPSGRLYIAFGLA